MADQPQNFLKAPTYTNFQVERAPLKKQFLVKMFQKVPKNAFLAFFEKFACVAKFMLK